MPGCECFQDMFNKAANPRRVFVGAVQQLYEFQEACWHTGAPISYSVEGLLAYGYHLTLTFKMKAFTSE